MDFKSKYYLFVTRSSSNAFLPKRSTKHSAGYDLYSPKFYYINPHEKILINTQISLKIPKGYYGRIAGRSSIAKHHFVDVLAGVVDNDYTGNIKVLLYNFGDKNYEIYKGDRIAQIIIEKYCSDIEVVEVKGIIFEECEDKRERENKGFGSTGK